MQRLLIKNISHFGGFLKTLRLGDESYYNGKDLYKDMGYKDVPEPDFRPELKNEFHISDYTSEFYVSKAEKYRVYMPLRKMKPEENTKYLGDIIKVVESYCTHLVSIILLIKYIRSLKKQIKLI